MTDKTEDKQSHAHSSEQQNAGDTEKRESGGKIKMDREKNGEKKNDCFDKDCDRRQLGWWRALDIRQQQKQQTPRRICEAVKTRKKIELIIV